MCAWAVEAGNTKPERNWVK